MKRILCALLLLFTIFTLPGCEGVYHGIEPKPPTTPQNPGNTSNPTDDPADPKNQEFTVQILFDEEVFTGTAGIEVQWANETSVQRATFGADHVARIKGLDGDYVVTLHGLPEKYVYDANAYIATNGRRELVIEIFEHIKTKGSGKDPYSAISITRPGGYTTEIKKAGSMIYYQFSPTRAGTYYVDTIADINANEINPSIDVYNGHIAYKQYSHTIDSGATEANYTRNARYVIEVDAKNVGGVYTFGVTATQKEGLYPVTVTFLLRYAGSYKNEDYYRETIPQHADAAELAARGVFGDDDIEKGTLTYPERKISDKVYVLDGSMFALNPADGYYHLKDANGEPNGPILYAKIRRRHRFFADYTPPGSSVGFEVSFTGFGAYETICVEDPGNAVLQHLGDNSDENYRPFIFEYADYITNEEGVYPVTEDLKEFLQKFSVSQRYFSDGNGWAETTAEDEIGYRLYSSEEDQWLFACCYYS